MVNNHDLGLKSQKSSSEYFMMACKLEKYVNHIFLLVHTVPSILPTKHQPLNEIGVCVAANNSHGSFIIVLVSNMLLQLRLSSLF